LKIDIKILLLLLLVFLVLRIMPPKQVSLSPNEGAQIEVVKTAVNIKRNRLKLTVNGGGGSGGGGVVSDKSFTEPYLASLSELERRVCSIAQAHLESSFDLSRSNGYVAWNTK
jgi:hypothetical protein